ncbi:hypothetical protein [Actinotignum urinale]|uniref:Uncharacterized protein n=1 Tax=Actinotignum urinale TaxID=190146 RepID=A0ABU5G7Y5_9ACTO|nr:hypothetical protein [Actinotignum urinale]MDY5132790.1 hypothetical protein [Actinotignum urinale]
MRNSSTVVYSIDHGEVGAEFYAQGGAVFPRFYTGGTWRSVLGNPQPFPAGDVLAIPFGTPVPTSLEPSAHFYHGYAANNLWTVTEITATEICATIAYPETSAIERIDKHVYCDRGAVVVEDRVKARRKIRMPVGYSWVIDLPDAPGSLNLTIPRGAFLESDPRQMAPSRIAKTVDFEESHYTEKCFASVSFPATQPGSDIVQIVNIDDGVLHLQLPGTGETVSMMWDRDALSHLMIHEHTGEEGQRHWVALSAMQSIFDYGLDRCVEIHRTNAKYGRVALRIEPDEPLELSHWYTLHRE